MITATGITLKELDMHRDIYYRGYRLSIMRESTPTQTIHIHAPGDPTLLALVPTEEKAREVVDGYHNAP